MLCAARFMTKLNSSFSHVFFMSPPYTSCSHVTPQWIVNQMHNVIFDSYGQILNPAIPNCWFQLFMDIKHYALYKAHFFPSERN